MRRGRLVLVDEKHACVNGSSREGGRWMGDGKNGRGFIEYSRKGKLYLCTYRGRWSSPRARGEQVQNTYFMSRHMLANYLILSIFSYYPCGQIATQGERVGINRHLCRA